MEELLLVPARHQGYMVYSKAPHSGMSGELLFGGDLAPALEFMRERITANRNAQKPSA